MNHQKIYDAIIQKAKSENRIIKSYYKRKKENSNFIYYEDHHVIPVCLNGSDEKENMQLLTAKEHYVCHKLLTYIYPNNRSLIYAFHMMANTKKGKRKLHVSLRDYAYIKELRHLNGFSEEHKQHMRDVRRKPKTEEQKKKRRIKLNETLLDGRSSKIEIKNCPICDKLFTDHSHMFKKICCGASCANIKKFQNLDYRKKWSNSRKGRKCKPYKNKGIPTGISPPNKGTKGLYIFTDKDKEKMINARIARMGKPRKLSSQQCIYCRRILTTNQITRYHNEKCKCK